MYLVENCLAFTINHVTRSTMMLHTNHKYTEKSYSRTLDAIIGYSRKVL